ncbi:AI-2E family transporter [Poseidonocella sp. HB161398]|uniref:AI-2E family transporter n=1 Tax=Poseidonocella sp. HB161398 TaxID=2320855 RepID=UPI0014869E52|nr:AI-2E family transporter [Poseidonocella sp. HB161398]
MTPGSATPEDERGTALVRLAAALVILTIVLSGLTLGARIFVPLAEALIVWFVLNRMAAALRRTRWLGPRLSHGGAMALAAACVALIGLVAVYSGVRGLLANGPQTLSLAESLDPLVARLSKLVGADAGLIVDRMLDAVGLERLMQQVVLGMIGLINQFGVVAIYVGFLLADQALFPAKMRALFPDPARRAEAEALLGELAARISSYLWIMTRVSALTAALSWLAMWLLGLHNALFWAILVFVLNFIPTIGSVLGVMLPTAFAILQFGELGGVVVLGCLLGAVQFTIGNILLPRMAGQTLNISLVVTILALFVWGALWGVTGLFLAVPLTAMLVIVAARFEASRPIAVMLSRTGEFGARPEPGSGPAAPQS